MALSSEIGGALNDCSLAILLYSLALSYVKTCHPAVDRFHCTKYESVRYIPL